MIEYHYIERIRKVIAFHVRLAKHWPWSKPTKEYMPYHLWLWQTKGVLR